MSNRVYASEVQRGLASGSSQALEGSVPLHNERKRRKVSRTGPRKVSRASLRAKRREAFFSFQYLSFLCVFFLKFDPDKGSDS